MKIDPRYHDEWQTVSRYVRELFDFYCARCEKNCRNPNNANSILQVHHIDENPANNDLCNLIPLCASCHLKIEGEARLHAPHRETQMEMFVDHTYMTQMRKMREDALKKYGFTNNSDVEKMDKETYEMYALDWEKNESL